MLCWDTSDLPCWAKLPFMEEKRPQFWWVSFGKGQHVPFSNAAAAWGLFFGRPLLLS